MAAWVFAREAVRLRRDGRSGWIRALARAEVAVSNRLGATFIEVGQIASTRGDLLPPEAVEELSRLRDQVPPFAFARVREVIEASFGRPLLEIYAAFEPEPVAAASVAQVHRARLREGGACVAVKVRRPGVVEKVALDRSILIAGARLAERVVPSLRLVSVAEAVATFCDAVEHQLHLGNEADHNRLFAFATGDGKTVARLFFDRAPHTATPDYATYGREISEFVERLRVLGRGNVQLALEIGRIFDILRRHRIQARSHMTMVNLALATAEGLGKRLAPDLSLADEALGIPAPPQTDRRDARVTLP